MSAKTLYVGDSQEHAQRDSWESLFLMIPKESGNQGIYLRIPELLSFLGNFEQV